MGWFCFGYFNYGLLSKCLIVFWILLLFLCKVVMFLLKLKNFMLFSCCSCLVYFFLGGLLLIDVGGVLNVFSLFNLFNLFKFFSFWRVCFIWVSFLVDMLNGLVVFVLVFFVFVFVVGVLNRVVKGLIGGVWVFCVWLFGEVFVVVLVVGDVGFVWLVFWVEGVVFVGGVF